MCVCVYMKTLESIYLISLKTCCLCHVSTSYCCRVRHLYLVSRSHMRYRTQSLTVSSTTDPMPSHPNNPNPNPAARTWVQNGTCSCCWIPKNGGAGSNLVTFDLLPLQWFIPPPVPHLPSSRHFLISVPDDAEATASSLHYRAVFGPLRRYFTK